MVWATVVNGGWSLKSLSLNSSDKNFLILCQNVLFYAKNIPAVESTNLTTVDKRTKNSDGQCMTVEEKPIEWVVQNG